MKREKIFLTGSVEKQSEAEISCVCNINKPQYIGQKIKMKKNQKKFKKSVDKRGVMLYNSNCSARDDMKTAKRWEAKKLIGMGKTSEQDLEN